MAVPATGEEFLDLVRKSGVADEKRLDAFMQKMRAGNFPTEPAKLAGLLIQDSVITNFQAENILAGKWRRFSIGKYKVLEKLGSGGFAQVYLCEHKLMRRRVAVKVLPIAKAKDSSALDRFLREARAVAALDHPNIVHAYDIDQDADLHFLVMEYVDGCNLQEIVKATGPLSVLRACHYIRQSALALQHAHENAMVHRDIKPGNILVDRTGVVKVLDMGLALLFHEGEDDLTKKHDDGTIGTADYLSPEQAMDSHDVDIRTDIYSLGVTFYFLLAGRAPYEGMPMAQKLLSHQMKAPKPIAEYRRDVPAGVLAILDKMMAKKADERYATPGDVADALEPFTQVEIAPPTDAELPHLSPAASGSTGVDTVESIAKRNAQTAKAASSAAKMKTPMPAAKPSVSAPQSAPVTAVAESPSWEQIASSESDTSKAADDTAPLSSRRAKKPKADPVALRRYILIAGMTLLVVVALLSVASLCGTLVWFIFGQRAQAPAPGPVKIEVSQDRPGAERSIQAALRKAELGSTIELWDELYEENIVIEPGKGRTAITLTAAPGKSILWRTGGTSPDLPLIKLNKAADFKLKGKGITLTGAMSKSRNVRDLILITSDCNGSSLEDLELTAFARSGVFLINAVGFPQRPIKLQRLAIQSDTRLKQRGAIYFDANPQVLPPINDEIHIDDCDFRGFEPGNAVTFKDNSVLGKNVRWPGR
jgi:serine/threonine protein kinase